MQRLSEIKSTYDWFFKQYEKETTEQAKNNDLAGIDRMDTKRDILERGIFILMFGQFETAVKTAFKNALNARISNNDWTKRRGWDANSLRGEKIPFETMLAMVLDKNLPLYKEIIQVYNIRNHCAHGGTKTNVGSINAIESKIYTWHSALQS